MDARSVLRPFTADDGVDRGPGHLAPDCAGQNFYTIDRGLRDLLPLYLSPSDFHAMSHRSGVLGLDRPLPAVAKYALQYLFVQAEFGLMCPISVTDTSIHLIRKFASAELQDYLLPKMLSGDVATLWKGTQFMTERSGGSDVGAIETTARCENGVWRLFGDKWFCSHADADVALLLARPEGAAPGTRGLALFALPRRLKDGRRNAYRIVRLKDKLGTRSMASGEILLEGAVAYLIGEADRGLKQMMEQVNLSRLSHGVRAAAMMRRGVNEAMVCARGRVAFGKAIIEYPLLRRQLLKITVPTEQALSMFLFAADAMDRANAGSKEAEDCLRILTPLLKFRACRDNIPVATGAMEVRGGNGYIEEWVHARLIRDAHIGVLWEGTSNINALDIVTRAVGKNRAHRTLETALRKLLDEAAPIPAAFRDRLRLALDKTIVFVERVAAEPALEATARQAASALYHVTSTVLMTWEAAQPAADARRALYARFVLEHRLSPQDPLEPRVGDWERDAAQIVFSEHRVALAEIAGLLN